MAAMCLSLTIIYSNVPQMIYVMFSSVTLKAVLYVCNSYHGLCRIWIPKVQAVNWVSKEWSWQKDVELRLLILDLMFLNWNIYVYVCVCVCIIYIIILLYILYNRCTHRHVYSQCFLKFLFKEKIKILRLKWTFLDYNFLLPELRVECCFLDSDIFLSTCGKPNKIVPELSTLTTCIDALFL